MQKQATNTKQEMKSEQIHNVLYNLEIHLEKFLDEVKKGYALYRVGKKTDFIEQIEKMIEQPMEHLFDISKNIDQNILLFLDNVVTNFIKTENDIVKEAYKLKTTNQLQSHYIFTLQKDTIENRDKIFSFLDTYELTELSHKYPIYFQFSKEEYLPALYIEKKIVI